MRVCRTLGLCGWSETPPPSLADSGSEVSPSEGPRGPAPRVPGDTLRAAQGRRYEARRRHSRCRCYLELPPAQAPSEVRGVGGSRAERRRADCGGLRRRKTVAPPPPRGGGGLRSAGAGTWEARGLRLDRLRSRRSVGARVSAGGRGTDAVRTLAEGGRCGGGAGGRWRGALRGAGQQRGCPLPGSCGLEEGRQVPGTGGGVDTACCGAGLGSQWPRELLAAALRGTRKAVPMSHGGHCGAAGGSAEPETQKGNGHLPPRPLPLSTLRGSGTRPALSLGRD